MAHTANVVIIGGGIVGSSIGCHPTEDALLPARYASIMAGLLRWQHVLMRFRSSGSGLWLLLSLLGLLVACACTRRPAIPEQPKPKNLSELRQAIQELLNRNQIPGAGVALVTREQVIWAGGVGKADLAANRDVTADTQFRVGSISKSFVALALLQLQEQKKMDLNARLKEVAPEIPVPNPWEQTHPVTVAEVLEHTASFDDMSPREVYNLQDPPSIPLLEVLQRFPRSLAVRWPPGSRMSYSNPGYAVAGYLIEKAAGKRFEEYVVEAILRPLGMGHSDFRLTESNRVLLAQGYRGRPPKPVPYRNIYYRPAGDLKCSPAELARWVQMLLNRGRLGGVQLVRPDSVARMEVPQTSRGAHAGLRNAYSLGVAADFTGPVLGHGHDGGIDGFFSSYRYFPGAGLGYVALINSSASPGPLRDLNDLLRGYLLSPVQVTRQPAIQLSEAELQKFTGYYEAANPRNQAFAFLNQLLGGRRVFLREGALYEKALFGPAQRLLPLAANLFRLEPEPEASTVFCTTEDGRQVSASLRFYGERVNPLWPTARLWLMAASLVLVLSSFLFALVWIPRKLLGRMKNVRHLWVRVMPLVAGLALVAPVAMMSQTSPLSWGTRNAQTVSVWLSTWVFFVSSLLALVVSLRSFRLGVHPGVRIHSLLVSLACSVLAVFLASWGMIGLRLWAL